MEDCKIEVTNIDLEEWLVLEMSEMYSPQLVTGTSGTPSELEGCGENTKDMGDTVQLKTQTVHIKGVHTVTKTSLLNVRKVK